MSIPYADILILALIAGFILLRLRSILGQDSGFSSRGDENPPPKDITRESSAEEKVFPLHPGSAVKLAADAKAPADAELIKTLDADIQDVIEDMKKIEPSFDLNQFIAGAKGAFEMVLNAFEKNDKETLKHLLADDIEDLFVEHAQANQDAKVRTETTLVSIPKVEIMDARLHRKKAAFDVRFLSEQISVERDQDGKISGGDASQIKRVEDEWTFERELGSKHPNWLVTAT